MLLGQGRGDDVDRVISLFPSDDEWRTKSQRALSTTQQEQSFAETTLDHRIPNGGSRGLLGDVVAASVMFRG